ncbi:X8 domain, partial [Dillenia turbinata]
MAKLTIPSLILSSLVLFVLFNSGQACFYPNTLINRASVAMNLYYQANGRNYWNCYFQNSGLIVISDPIYHTFFNNKKVMVIASIEAPRIPQKFQIYIYNNWCRR